MSSTNKRPRAPTVAVVSSREQHFQRIKKELTRILDGEFPKEPTDQIFQEMLFNVGRMREERLDVVELKLLNTAMRELRYALQVFKPYRDTPKAAVFGSARTPKHHPNYRLAVEFGRRLVKKKWMLITGGASGIMEAAMEGAQAKNCFGLNIMLPFEQFANPIIRDNKKLMLFKYFFTRKLMFLKESEATVLFPGGFGTFDEGFESFTLVQTGKAKPRPLVLLDQPASTYWVSLLTFMRDFLQRESLIAESDLSLLRHFHSADRAVAEITGFYSNFHSSRFIEEQYLIRLKRQVSPEALRQLSKEFKDILEKGQFRHFKDVPRDDNHDPALERIIFFFDRTNYSRLRELIDRFNLL